MSMVQGMRLVWRFSSRKSLVQIQPLSLLEPIPRLVSRVFTDLLFWRKSLVAPFLYVYRTDDSAKLITRLQIQRRRVFEPKQAFKNSPTEYQSTSFFKAEEASDAARHTCQHHLINIYKFLLRHEVARPPRCLQCRKAVPQTGVKCSSCIICNAQKSRKIFSSDA